MIGRVCWFVRYFVGSLRSLSLLDKYMTDFHETWYRCSASVPSFTVDFSEVKVRVQGQNHRTEYLQIVMSRPWFETSSPNLEIRQRLQRSANNQQVGVVSALSKLRLTIWRRFGLSECFSVSWLDGCTREGHLQDGCHGVPLYSRSGTSVPR